jgi:hypothetical protein
MFRLAGSGWYETDFKSDKETKRNIHEKGDKEPAAAETKESAPVKTEAKAEAAKPAKSRTMVTKPAKAPAGRKPAPAAKKKTSARARKR